MADYLELLFLPYMMHFDPCQVWRLEMAVILSRTCSLYLSTLTPLYLDLQKAASAEFLLSSKSQY